MECGAERVSELGRGRLLDLPGLTLGCELGMGWFGFDKGGIGVKVTHVSIGRSNEVCKKKIDSKDIVFGTKRVSLLGFYSGNVVAQNTPILFCSLILLVQKNEFN